MNEYDKLRQKKLLERLSEDLGDESVKRFNDMMDKEEQQSKEVENGNTNTNNPLHKLDNTK